MRERERERETETETETDREMCVGAGHSENYGLCLSYNETDRRMED